MSRTAVVLALALTVVGLGPVPEASAQTSKQTKRVESNTTSQWRANFDEQIARALQHFPEQRSSYLRIAMNVAADEPTLDLSKTANVLMEIIRDDTCYHRRLMAVQVLNTLGPEHIGTNQYSVLMSQLLTLTQQEPSKQLRRVAHAAINGYAQRG